MAAGRTSLGELKRPPDRSEGALTLTLTLTLTPTLTLTQCYYFPPALCLSSPEVVCVFMSKMLT